MLETLRPFAMISCNSSHGTLVMRHVIVMAINY